MRSAQKPSVIKTQALNFHSPNISVERRVIRQKLPPEDGIQTKPDDLSFSFHPEALLSSRSLKTLRQILFQKEKESNLKNEDAF